MATTALLRHSTRCAQCGATVSAPEWSESAGEQGTIHLWHCIICGHEFETKDFGVEQKPSDAELVQEFLPNLLVA
jgi:Zn ribbon nucleic-acid-binding protein